MNRQSSRYGLFAAMIGTAMRRKGMPPMTKTMVAKTGPIQWLPGKLGRLYPSHIWIMGL